MNLRSRLRLRRAQPENQTTLYLRLLSGLDTVYSVELPVERAEDDEGKYVVIAQHFRTLDFGVTFDRIELQARYRDPSKSPPSAEDVDELLEDMLADERDDRDPDERLADEEAEDAERKLDSSKVGEYDLDD